MAKVSFAEKIKKLFSSKKTDSEEFFEELIDNLIEGDVGAKTSYEIADILEKKCRKDHITSEADILNELKNILKDYVKSVDLVPNENTTNIFMVLGVNGVGKTTSVAKLGNYYRKNGTNNIVLAAADTFRAAAIEQLSNHGEKLDIRVVCHQHGSDPAAVIYDAAEASKAKGSGLVLADTAGRLHNKDNLVRELQKIDRICKEKASPECYKRVLVIDGTTGQNALRQAEVFNDAVGIDAIILTKYDSTAKCGVAISIGKELGLPVAFICTGEKYEDIRKFDSDEYIDNFLGM